MNRGTVSKRVTALINFRKTYAVLALVGLIASLSGAEAAAEKEGAPLSVRLPWPVTGEMFDEMLEQRIDAVPRETPEESVRMLMQDPFMVFLGRLSVSSVTSGEARLRHLMMDSRVAKLLDFAGNASEEQRASLLVEIKKMCRHFAEELPVMPESCEDISTTVARPGGAIAYPLLLSVFDDKVETLPLLLEMQARHQGALRKKRAEDSEAQVGVGDEKDKETYVLSTFGQIAAYACAKLLGKGVETPALRSALSSRQAQILDQFAKYNERVIPADGSRPLAYYFDEETIFKFAQDFVQAANG